MDGAKAWWHATQERVADRIEPVVHGTVVRSSEFPTYYDYNQLRVGATDADAATLAAEADRALEGLDHRKVEIDDEASGRRLRPGFEALGWRTSRIVWLASDEPVTAPAPAGLEIVEVKRSEILPLRREWSEHWTAEQVEAFVPVEDAVALRLGVRVVAARKDGRLIGFVQWRAAGDAGEMMLVYVTPAARDAGTGAAMIADSVARARAAGARRIYIAADDERDARRLYERLGFRATWYMHEFTLEPR